VFSLEKVCFRVNISSFHLQEENILCVKIKPSLFMNEIVFFFFFFFDKHMDHTCKTPRCRRTGGPEQLADIKELRKVNGDLENQWTERQETQEQKKLLQVTLPIISRNLQVPWHKNHPRDYST
jgi:hypothetical protein